MKDDIISLLLRTIDILSHELCMRSNDTDINWKSGAYTQAVYEKYILKKGE